MTNNIDIAVIGAGPVGLFAVFECGMLKMRCHVIDSLPNIGGQCSALYPEKPIYDIPAHPMITGQGLIDNLAAQVLPFAPQYHLQQQVIEVNTNLVDGTINLLTNAGTNINIKVVIIAAGVGAFGPNRPPLANIEQFEPHAIHYCVKSIEYYRNKKIVIAGGGDSAIDWALTLKDVAAKLTVVHRRANFRGAPESEAKLYAAAEKGEIDILTPFQLAGLEGNNGQLSGVLIESLTGDKKSIEADFLLPFFGMSMNLGPISQWGLSLTKGQIAVEQSTCMTNVPNIYAIGDVANYPNKLKLILTGFAEAAQAANHIRHTLYPNEIMHFEYSTTRPPSAKFDV